MSTYFRSINSVYYTSEDEGSDVQKVFILLEIKIDLYIANFKNCIQLQYLHGYRLLQDAYV